MNLVWTLVVLAVPIVVAVDSRKLDWYEEHGCDKYMPPRMKEMLGCVPSCDEIEDVLSDCLSSTSCPYVTIQDLNMVGRSTSLCCDDIDEYFDNISCYACRDELHVWETCAKESETFSCVERCEPDKAIPEPETEEETRIEDWSDATKTEWDWGGLDDAFDDFNLDGDFDVDEIQDLVNDIFESYNSAHFIGSPLSILYLAGLLTAIFSYWQIV